MSAPRVLIVEPDAAFALSLAALVRDEGWGSAVAGSAAEAELEVGARRPALVVLRAELPDRSGFSLSAALRRAQLPVILYSAETGPESLAEHARTSWAASGYLSMPLDTGALVGMARRLLEPAEPVELADDDPDLLEVEADPVGADPEAVSSRPATPPLPSPQPASAGGPPPLRPAQPPPVPRRPRRELLTEEDRLFADRVFQSVADRRDALLAEAERRRPPPRRDLLATPEGRVTLLREELRWREAQLARLAEVWEIREREVAGVDERVHGKDVEVQRARQEAEGWQRRLEDAQRRLGDQDREHGASIEGLLSEKFKEEKELIEVVAGTERRLHEQDRELRSRDERLAAAAAEADGLRARIEALEEEGRALRQQGAEREGQVEGLERSAFESDQRLAESGEEVEARDALLRGARREVDRLQGELSAARQALMLRETELRGEVSRARSDAEELAGLLAQTTRERDEGLVRVGALQGELAAARAEAGALGAELEAVRERKGGSGEGSGTEPTILERLAPGPDPGPVPESSSPLRPTRSS
jgi:ParB family chromosome partitioning protein